MKLLRTLLLACFASASFGAQAGVIVTTDTSVQDVIPALTGFQTTGAMMDGLLVTVHFTSGFSQTLAWADTGATSGGVFGNGWSLTEDGDTFSGIWNFSINPDAHGQLESFMLDASGPHQVTVFDTTFGGNIGTANSASGKDFVFGPCTSCDATAAYSNAVAISPDPAVGDTFHTLIVTFDKGTGPRSDFTFTQDADNDDRIRTGFVPEPGSMALMGLAMLGMGAVRRRRRD